MPSSTDVNLSKGRLATGYVTVYRSPADKPTRVFLVNFVSASDTPQEVVLYLEGAGGGGRTELARGTLTARGWRLEALSGELPIGPGDKLVATASDGNAVDYVVSGILQL